MSSPGQSHGFDQAHAALLGRSDFQFDFPAFEPPKIPAWLEWLVHALQWAGPGLKWVFWGLVALAALALVYGIGRELWRLRRPLRITREERADLRQEWRPTEEAARILLDDADSLAAQGLFAEAVHLLLLRSVQDIAARMPHLLKPALTSREIGALASLPDAIRLVFADIARVVERSRFGGRAVTREDYERCRGAYERFAFPDAWRAAA